jgi:hypothetical protein
MSLIDTIREFLEDGEPEEYEVAEYVLERREPDPNPRVITYEELVEPGEVEAEHDLTSGEYLLQEIKESGMAGDVVWREELTFEEEQAAQ